MKADLCDNLELDWRQRGYEQHDIESTLTNRNDTCFANSCKNSPWQNPSKLCAQFWWQQFVPGDNSYIPGSSSACLEKANPCRATVATLNFKCLYR